MRFFIQATEERIKSGHLYIDCKYPTDGLKDC